MEREWIIEQRNSSDQEFTYSQGYVLDYAGRILLNLNQQKIFCEKEIYAARRTAFYPNPQVGRLVNELKALDDSITDLNEVIANTKAARLREWVPVYLFRHCDYATGFKGPDRVPSTNMDWRPWMSNVMYDFIELPTTTTTLERCVELVRDVESVVKTKQLRIRNIYTSEVVPCELF